MLSLRPATEADIEALIGNDLKGSNPIRQMDKDEAVSLTGKSVHTVLRRQALAGVVSMAIVEEHDQPLAIWGIFEEVHEGVLRYFGWFVATDMAQSRGREMHRAFKHCLDGCPETIFAVTTNIHLDGWHRALGFELVSEALYEDYLPIKIYRREPSWAHLR